VRARSMVRERAAWMHDDPLQDHVRLTGKLV
jgi:hypothetical protein